MLTVTRWFIKAGMIYLATGFLLLFIDSIPVIEMEISLLPVYWHMIAIGWITQVIMGVSIWMFPRKRRDKAGMDTPLTWAIFWTLNTGLVLRFITEPFLGTTNIWNQWIIVLSILLQFTAVSLYIAEIWPRVQPKVGRKQKSGDS
jgi:hypothetical protein